MRVTIPAPALVSTTNFFSRGRHRPPIVMTEGSSHAHQALGTQDAIHGRKRDKEHSQIPCGNRQDAVGKVRVPLLDRKGCHGCAFLREKPMDWRVLGAWLAIIKTLASLPDPRPPDHNQSFTSVPTPYTRHLLPYPVCSELRQAAFGEP